MKSWNAVYSPDSNLTGQRERWPEQRAIGSHQPSCEGIRGAARHTGHSISMLVDFGSRQGASKCILPPLYRTQSMNSRLLEAYIALETIASWLDHCISRVQPLIHNYYQRCLTAWQWPLIPSRWVKKCDGAIYCRSRPPAGSWTADGNCCTQHGLAQLRQPRDPSLV